MDVRFGLWRKLSADELMLLNCGVGEDSWDSLGLQGDPTSPSWWRSVLGVQWKDWCWSWNSSSLATSWEVLTHWKRPLPESSSSSQGISLKGWAVSVDNDVASDSRCHTMCLFQASGLLSYFFKSIRSEVLHFQLPLTQIYNLLVALQAEFLFQRFSQNRVDLWLHCDSCWCLGCVPHSSVYFLSF